ELAMAWIPGVEVSRVEEELGGESRTLRTLETVARSHPDWRLRLVIGADILGEAPRWFGFETIAKLAPPIGRRRAGFGEASAGAALLPGVPSPRVRAAIPRGAWSDVEKLVPRAVVAHIRARG